MVIIPRRMAATSRRAARTVRPSPVGAPESGCEPTPAFAPRLRAEAIQLQDVVCRAHWRPFRLRLGQAAQQKGSKAARLLDLADDRFDHRFPTDVDGRARLREELAGHALDRRGGRRHRAAWTGPRTFAMFLFARRDVE